jgi:hypothetical protein
MLGDHLINREMTVASGLDRVLVRADCPTCGAQLTSPYLRVRKTGFFACGCGTEVDVNLPSVTTQAILALFDDQGSKATV